MTSLEKGEMTSLEKGEMTSPLQAEVASSSPPPTSESVETSATEGIATAVPPASSDESRGTTQVVTTNPAQPVSSTATNAETTPAIPTAEAVATTQVVTTPPTAPGSEMKLTGDNYDYSDIGGQVTEEMKAELEAHAGSIESVEDEVALARRLLGLDVEEVTATPASAPSVATQTVATLGGAAATAEISSVAPAAEAVAPVETRRRPVIRDNADQVAPAAEAVAPVETAVAPTAETVLPVENAAPIESAAAAIETIAATQTIAPIETTAAPATQEKEPEAIDWMTALAAASSAAVASQVAEDRTEELAQPMADGATEVATTEPPARIEEGELPPWLQEIAPAATADALASEAELGEEEMPPWAHELAPDAAMVGASATLAHLPDLDEQEREELPDWLREPIGEEGAGGTGEDEAVKAEERPPIREATFDLPTWFTAGEQAPGKPMRDPFETIETTGPLAGISGILPLAVAITEPHRLTPPTPTRSDGGRIFQTILAEPLAPAAPVVTEAKAKPLFTVNHLVYLLILLAALVPMFLSLDNAGLGLSVTNGATADFYAQLQTIPAGGTVLLAFDYTPGQAVELDPAARVIVNDLAARKANVIAVSSNPFGAGIAQTLLSQAQAAQPQFTFVNLGYIYGNESGLRELALGWLPADYMDANGGQWGDSPLAQQVHGFDELAQSILIVGDDASLRAWMEQVQPRVTTPFIAATTALLEPQARNYVNARQLQASLRGLTGAAELELSSNQTGLTVKTVDALSVVSLVLAGIIIVANVVWVVRRKGSK